MGGVVGGDVDGAVSRPHPSRAARLRALSERPLGGDLRIPALPYVLLAVYSAAALVLLGARAGAAIVDRPYNFFTRDPVEALIDTGCFGLECVGVGAVSNIGVLIWMTGAVVCLLTGALSRWALANSTSWTAWLVAGAITLVLTIDDMFGLHEDARWDMPVEEVLVVAYGGALGAFVIAYRRFVARTSYLVLILALVFFAFSILVDRVYPGHPLAEDGSKLLGIVSWSTYFAGTAFVELRAAFLTTADRVPSTPDSAD